MKNPLGKILKKKPKTKKVPRRVTADNYPVMNIDNIPDDGNAIDLDPTEWMVSQDVINEIDPSRVRCWYCFKYISKKEIGRASCRERV